MEGRRGRREGVGVAKEVMNGEGFRTGGGRGKWSIVRDHSFQFIRRKICQVHVIVPLSLQHFVIHEMPYFSH